MRHNNTLNTIAMEFVKDCGTARPYISCSKLKTSKSQQMMMEKIDSSPNSRHQ
jgi:hypothetical protein